MLKSIETQGINRDDAIQKALEALGMDRDSVSVEVLDMGKKGFLGIGATPARVRVTYEAPEEAPVIIKKPEPRVAEAVKQAPAAVKQAPAGAVKQAPARAVVHEKNMSTPVQEKNTDAPLRTPSREKNAFVPMKTEYTPGTPMAAEKVSAVGRDAVTFIDGLLEKLGVDGHAVVLDSSTGETVHIEVVGSDMGPVIGRRGDTLDAIQYLASLVANRNREEHTRITLDTENYRAKREESLQRLAHKMAGKVLKYRKNMTLEPMNPYERRIIHATLQDVKGVTTYSTGTEPGRRVVIALEGRIGGQSRGGYSQRNHNGRAR